MDPILFELGPVRLYTYGLLVASGFFFGIKWAARLAKREGIDVNFIYDTAFWAIVGAIIGARFVFILTNLSYFIDHPVDILKIWAGGLVFYGGLLGVIVAVVICARKASVDIWALADVIAPAGALGHGIGRIGCFFAGCCYGKETHVDWAVTFHDSLSIAPTGIPLHPTQLYSAANEFILFIILSMLWPYRRFKGQILLTWVVLYGITRSVIEIFRGDPRGLYFDGMVSTSQIIAGIVITVAIWLYFRNKNLYPTV